MINICARIFVSLPLFILCTILCVSFYELSGDDLKIFATFAIYIYAINLILLLTGFLNALQKNRQIFFLTATKAFLIILILYLSHIYSLDVVRAFLVISILIIIMATYIVYSVAYADEPSPKIFRGQFRPKRINKIFMTGIPLIFGSAAEFANLKSDVLILGMYVQSDLVGTYVLAVNIYLALSLFPMAATRVFFPRFIKSQKSSNREAHRLLSGYIIVYLIYSIFCIVLFFLFGQGFVEFTFGSDLKNVYHIATVLIFALPIVSIGRLLKNVAHAMGWYRQLLYITLTSLIINILLNFIFINKYGLLAAAIATLVSEMITLYFLYRVWRVHLKKKNYAL